MPEKKVTATLKPAEKKGLPLKLIGAAVAAVIVFGIAVIAFFFLAPATAAPVEYTDPVNPDFKSQNTNLFAALYAGGIEDPFVDVDAERAYVAYELPSGADSDTMQRFAVGAAANAAPDVGKIVVVQYVGGTPSVSWTVQMSDFKEFMNAKITGEMLESRIEKKTL
jgi:hypothetical protein